MLAAQAADEVGGMRPEGDRGGLGDGHVVRGGYHNSSNIQLGRAGRAAVPTAAVAIQSAAYTETTVLLLMLFPLVVGGIVKSLRPCWWER